MVRKPVLDPLDRPESGTDECGGLHLRHPGPGMTETLEAEHEPGDGVKERRAPSEEVAGREGAFYRVGLRL